MPEKICIRCVVTGKVQGVWFRVGTQEQAKQLGVTGWARNLPSGQEVEVLACGTVEQVEQLYVWLQQGPELAQVSSVTRTEIPWQEHTRFAIK